MMENPLRSPHYQPHGKGGSQSRAPLNVNPMIRADDLTSIILEYATALNVPPQALAECSRVGTSSATRAYINPILNATQQARAYLNPKPTLIPWGTCPNCDQPLSAPAGAKTITCNSCHNQYDAQTLTQRLTGNINNSIKLTRSQTLKALNRAGIPTPESTLREWINTSKLTPQGVSEGKPTYALAQALNLALNKRSHTRRKHLRHNTVPHIRKTVTQRGKEEK